MNIVKTIPIVSIDDAEAKIDLDDDVRKMVRDAKIYGKVETILLIQCLRNQQKILASLEKEDVK